MGATVMTRTLASSLVVGAAAAVVLAGMTAPAASAVPLVAGAHHALQGMGARRPAPGNAVVSFTVGLKRSDSAAADTLGEVSDPTSSYYRHFLARNTIRSDFGATSNSLGALQDSAGKHGLTVSLDRTGVFATVTGRAREMSDWLGKQVTVSRGVPDGLEATLYQGRNKLPQSIRNKVREFVPIDLQVDGGVGASALPPYAGTNDGTPVSCLNSEGNKYVYAYNQLRTAYGIDDLPMSKKVGSATHVVIMGLGQGFSRQALAQSADCFDVAPMTLSRKPVPGLNTALPAGLEGQLDPQVVQSVLPPGSHVDVVEQAIFDGRWYLAWARAFRLQRHPDALTTSYGMCEQETGNLLGFSKSLTEAVLVRLGLTGATAFSAAGDQGSSDCVENNGTGEGNRKLAVDYPSSSRYVTAVGGTRLIVDKANGRVGEWVWNATAAEPPVGPSLAGGGGGTSRWFDRPSWQPQSMSHSSMRTLPDLAAHAANGPFWPLFTGESSSPFEPVGGTSAATPMTAAAVGVIAAQQRVKSKPALGLIQPLLYRLQQKHPQSFYDVVDGNNDVYGQGCCSAKAGYDKASGLGSPNFGVWLDKLPAPGR